MAPDADEEAKQEESLSEDEDAIKLVERRTSINIENVIGLDLEHYNKIKPSKEIKLKIKNLVMEYLQEGDSGVASEDFKELCVQTETKPFMVIGCVLNFSFSQDQGKYE